ncbi:MAG: putative membrane-bound dehydrogenase-like protein [Limisphaerales bacterium]|jgi:putative membrane-bound dehydrogenase-like protein
MPFRFGLPLLALALGMQMSRSQEFPAPVNNQRGEFTLTPPQDALQKFTLPKGFNISLFASEPDVHQPIAITTDARGRLWVAECYSYDDRENNYSAAQRDRIVILEDTNHDGQFDKRTVFWDKAWKLTSVEVGFGGVWALCAPNLLFIPDKDGDDIPDGEPIVVLDGWDDDKIRHNIVNGLKWGPDGWLYGRHGITMTSPVGKPGTPTAKRTQVNCSIWRYHPTREDFEIVCNGGTNPWGHDWNEVGELFWINTVIGHLWHGVPGGYFKRMFGEHLRPNLYESIDQHADHFHWDTRRKWSEERTATGITDTAGGGHAHCGMMIYLGDNWPKQYRGELFALNLLGRRINQDHLVREGTGYVGKHRSDFAQANDQWFRGVELIYGNDGGVYIADWCDVGECHENDGIHRTSGRIFKISYGKSKRPSAADLTKLTNEELVQMQRHANEWYPRQARKVLQERTASGKDMTEVHAGLMNIFLTAKPVHHKLRAMWGLNVTGGTSERWLEEQLNHSLENVRVWAVRLLTQEGEISQRTQQFLEKMAHLEESALVRLYLASALQRLPVDRRFELANALLQRSEDVGDHNQELLIWYGVEPLATAHPELAGKLIATSSMEKPRRYLARRLSEAHAEQNPEQMDRLLTLALSKRSNEGRKSILSGMAQALRGWSRAPKPQRWERAQTAFLRSKDEEIVRYARDLGVVFGSGRALKELREVALDSNADGASRRAALQTLIENKPDDLAKILKSLLNVRETQGVAARGMAAIDDPEVPNRIIGKYWRLNVEDRVGAISTLVSRASYAKPLLEGLGNGKIPRAAVKAFHARQIRLMEDDTLSALLRKHWGDVRETSADRKKLMDQYRDLMTPANLKHADLVQGRTLFNLACSTCHTLFGEGREVGPDITGGNRNNLAYILENLVDPSSMIAGDYKMSVITLRDGRVVNGVVLRTTDRTLEVQTPTEKLTFDRGSVKSVKSSALSLMPDGLLEAMTKDQARDLIAYLMSPKQVPLK